jgi:hypothetical protein
MWIGLGLVPGLHIIHVSCELVSLDGRGGSSYEEKQNVAAISSAVKHRCIFGIAVILWSTKFLVYLALTQSANCVVEVSYFLTYSVFGYADCCMHSFDCAVIVIILVTTRRFEICY